MAFKIGGMYYDIYPASAINRRGRAKYIFPIRYRPRLCPACGNLLNPEYALAIKVRANHYIKIYDNYCPKCDAFITTNMRFVRWLRKRKDRNDPEIRYEYYIPVRPSSFHAIFEQPSVYWQFVLINESRVIIVSLTCDDKLADSIMRIYPYTSEEGISLLRDFIDQKRHIVFQGKTHVLIDYRTKRIKDPELANTVNLAINNMKYSPAETPEITANSTVHIYNGNISCFHKHHLTEYKARITFLDQTMGFYVEYCHECDKFYMKYDDYERYLSKYHFFPFRVEKDYVDYSDRFQNHAEESPLKQFGYSVNQTDGLTMKQRQYILSYVITHGFLTKRKVLDYLEMFIRDGKNDIRKSIAIKRWNDDKEFVLSYSGEEVPVVDIISIVPIAR